MSSPDQVLEHARGSDLQLLGRGWGLVKRQLGRARKEFFIGFFGALLFAGATIGSSYVIGWVTDEVLVPSVQTGDISTALLAGAGAALLGMSMIRAVGIGLRRDGAYQADARLQQVDRVAVTDRYLTLPIEWHRRHPTGQLLSNVNSDVEAASRIAAPLPMAFGVVVMVLVTAVLLVLTDPFLALVGLLMLPAIAIVNYMFQRKMRVVAASAQRIRAEVAEIAHESFDAALVVKTLGREDEEVGRFGERSDALRDRMVDVGRLRAGFDPLIEAIPSLGILAVLTVGAWRVDQGLITAGTLVTFAYLFRLVAGPMRVFSWLLGQLPMAVAGMDRIDAILREREFVDYGSTTVASNGVGAGAQAEHVRYRYPTSDGADLTDVIAEDSEDERRGIESISLDVAPGKTIAMVGPTGSGKSTIAQLMVRLFDPDSGYITLDGHGLASLERDTLADNAAIVFQEAFLFDDTVANNITLGGNHTIEEIVAAGTLAQADGFINELPEGYETLVGERGTSLSGGQRQRIALARALIRRPRLLILDDATSAVDPSVEGAILDGLAQLDTTVVIVAYRRSSIVLADEVIFVEDGRVSDRGSHDELYRRLPAYRALIDAYEGDD
jgi:ATP-binding cassette subfamily B protein